MNKQPPSNDNDLQQHARRQMKTMAVRIANDVQKHLTGDFAQIQTLIDENEIVFAVWQDRKEADGVGILIIKGQAKLRDVVATGQSMAALITAIPCIEAEQALALQQVAGEPDRRH